ncbi:MAG TPA: hypothetical protein VNJ54_20970 [Plantibacter sp.]|uniref:hypothetical protein n=1 Tax=unclassified Plantibacter TaxID=2624265 RepID=UPI002C0B02AC|nr:hypothetical protein [Plantibacter sp.]
MTAVAEFAVSANGLSVLRSLEQLPGGKPTWSDLGVVVIDRSTHAIVPLARAPIGAEDATDERFLEVKRRMTMDGVHFYGGDGFHAETILTADEGYGRRLAVAGPEVVGRPIAWTVREWSAVLVHAIHRDLGYASLAFHLVPRDWAWYVPKNSGTKREASRHRRLVRECGEADASWSWVP